MNPTVREARDGDSDGMIALLAGVYAEYPGFVLDVDADEPGLRAVASHFASCGGRAWVAEADGRIVGSAAFRRAEDAAVVTLHYLYVERAARGHGLATRLLGLVEDAARACGAGAIELWTDIHFADAHRLYERLGFRRSPGRRTLEDASRSVEFHYRKALA